MAKIHKIKGRIRSVGKINQITKAMEKVAASKMRRAQEATLRSRTYAASSREALARLALHTAPAAHPLFQVRPVQSQLLIVFTSDRGLAGAYNSNIFKALLAAAADTPHATRALVVGSKGAQFVSKLRRQIDVRGVYTNWPTAPTPADVSPLVETAIDSFIAKEVDLVRLVFTDFISGLVQRAMVRDLLPVDPEQVFTTLPHPAQTAETLFEPSAAAVVNFIVPRLVTTQMYQAALEAIASEQSMRMVAMKNASDNAAELVDDLTLTYNGARQTAITQELAEISAGAQAMA